MSFGNDLLRGLNTQAGTGENTPRSLDTVDPSDPNRTVAFGELGDFAKKIDATAQRSYVESGYIRNVLPRFFEPLLQEPDITVVVKKKMFTSLINNYQFETMDEAEKNFIKASKRLFQNKCQAISIYEKLTKLERVVDRNDGQFNDLLFPLITTGIEAAQAFGFNWVSPKVKAALDSINKWKAFSNPELFTTWMVEPMAPYASSFGEGTGAFELTLVGSVNTSVSTKWGGGSIGLSIEDPYKLMMITSMDIDHAIADTYNAKKTSQLFQFSDTELQRQTNDLLSRLNRSRLLRGAPKIDLRVNNESLLSKRVRAFIGGTKEVIFNFNPGLFGVGAGADIDPSAFEGATGLSNEDGRQLSTIIKNTFLVLNLKRQQEAELEDVTDDSNRKQINYIREKMRLHFANKSIIQVMDSIHVFISSKSMVDNGAIGIDRNSVSAIGSNLLTSLNTVVNNLEQSFNNLQGFFSGGSRGSFVEAERDAIMGPDFPMWLWTSMRNDFTRQAAGVHVSAGVVTDVKTDYSEGKYTVSVNCQDNSYYFKLGELNVNPGVAPLDRSIFDPLTPFDLEFDASSGFALGENPKLLPENERLFFSGAVKFKNGSRFLGSPISSFLYGIGDNDRKDEQQPRNYQRIFFDPDGFVYRWKSGIGTFTFSGPRHSPKFSRDETSIRLTSNPFAGQDVMNVLSLLITGQPYNYNNFISSAVNNSALAFNTEAGGSGSRSDLDNVDISVSFFRNLISDIQKNNVAWGNFIPFKRLVVNEQGLKFMLLGQYNITKSNARLDRLLTQRAQLFDAFTMVSVQFANNPSVTGIDLSGNKIVTSPADGDPNLASIANTPEGLQAYSQLLLLDKNIVEQENQLFEAYNQANTSDGTLNIFGNDFSLSENINDGVLTESQRQSQREQFRRKMRWLTLRRLWKVKAAEDPNLLIVDDQYDKDYDIQAFERALAGRMELFKSDYSNIHDQVAQVSQILGLEVFADTQGHIQIRPPGYNKTPSSVFERMIRDRRRLFPKTLETLFINQIEGLTNALEVIEDEIRLRGAALGYTQDSALSKFLNGNARGDLTGRVGQGTFTFKFISSSDGIIAQNPGALKSLIQQDSPDLRESDQFKELKNIGQAIAGQIKEVGFFDKSAQLRNFLFNKDAFKVRNNVTQSRYEEIQFRLSKKKNVQAPSQTQLFSNVRGTPGTEYRTQGDILKVTREIATFVSERQVVLKKLHNLIRNIDQGTALNSDPKARRAALFPDLSNNKKTEFPSVIAHMIEDEKEDDLGLGSGGRYIIKENQIIRMSIQERPPDFTVVEVSGLFGEGFVQPPTGLEIGRGGNAVVSATSVDYDLWRMYGFKVANSRPVPFLSNPDTQCAPLATWMLSEQRRKIISGDIVIAGNEYMQPGEVVYIEDLDMLFYVETVNHSFSYGSNFTTSLVLTYGHNPGEYFPTMLDVVGKGLYSKGHNANLSNNVRFDRADGSQNIGVITVDNNDSARLISAKSKMVEGRYADQNRKTLTNLMLTLSGAYVPGSNFQPKVEIRHYYNSIKGFGESSSQATLLKEVSEAIIYWLTNPEKQSIGNTGNGDSLATQPLATGVGGLFQSKDSESLMPDASIPDGLRPDQINEFVKVVGIDLGSKSNPNSPSSKAWLGARETQTAASPYAGIVEDITSSFNQKKDSAGGNNPKKTSPEERSLYTNIIDIWVTFEPIQKTVETSKSDIAGQGSQAGQEDSMLLDEAEIARANSEFENSDNLGQDLEDLETALGSDNV